ncbi:MAG: hypothetical protein IJ806_06085 [Ruminococcus sp.]|nr:hypothetical protein [Ruminococcus sp.]
MSDKITSEDILANMNRDDRDREEGEKLTSEDILANMRNAESAPQDSEPVIAEESGPAGAESLEEFFRLTGTGNEAEKGVPVPEVRGGSEVEKLQAARAQKVENFVLGKKKTRAAGSLTKTAYGQKEFESFEEAAKVLNDILHVKNNLFLRICVLLFTGISSMLITVANDLELPVIRIFDRSVSPAAFLFSQVILGLLALGVSYTVMTEGLKNMLKRKPDCDSITAVSIFISVISAIVMVFKPESVRNGHYHIFISAAILGLIFNTVGKLMIVMRTEKNFRYAAGDFERYALHRVSDKQAAEFGDGVAPRSVKMLTMQKTGFVEDFIKNSYAPDITDKFAKKAAPLILLAGAIIAFMSFAFDKNAADKVEKIYVALAAFSGTVTMCSSVSLMLAVNVPVSKGCAKYLQNSGVILGYSAVEDYADTNSVLIDAEQLFPKDSIEIANIRLLSQNTLEECITLAASLCSSAGSVMNNAFYKMLKGDEKLLRPTSDHSFEDGLGLTAWCENKRVLLGTREHMEKHMIDGIPPASVENEYISRDTSVLYLSVSGVVSAMFVIKMSPLPSIVRSLHTLEREGVSMVIKCTDGFLSADMLSKLFSVDPGYMKLLPYEFIEDYRQQAGETERVSSSMLCSGSLKTMAMLIAGVKRIKLAAQLGIAIQMGSIALGGAICFLTMSIGSFSQITPTLVIAYDLIFAVMTHLFMRSKQV